MDDNFLVRNENEAWELFEKLVDGRVDPQNLKQLKLENWPCFKIYVPGKRLDASLTPYMMEGYIDLQRSVYRTHALIAHDALNARLLSDYEKQQLELVVKVRGGSSKTEADLWDIIGEIGSSAVTKMEPQQIMITILGLGLLWAGQSAFRVYLEARKDDKLADTQAKQVAEALAALKFTQEKDIERMKLFATAYERVPQLQPAKLESDQTKQSITRHVSKNIQADVNGVLLDGEVAQTLSRESRSESIEVRLDGNYRILRVDTTSPDGFKVKLEDLEDGTMFDAGVQDAILSEKQRAVLQSAEWSKQPVFAKINARKRRDEILDAIVIDAREVEK